MRGETPDHSVKGNNVARRVAEYDEGGMMKAKKWARKGKVGRERVTAYQTKQASGAVSKRDNTTRLDDQNAGKKGHADGWTKVAGCEASQGVDIRIEARVRIVTG